MWAVSVDLVIGNQRGRALLHFKSLFLCVLSRTSTREGLCGVVPVVCLPLGPSSAPWQCVGSTGKLQHKQAHLQLRKMLGSLVTADVWIFVSLLWPARPFLPQPRWGHAEELASALG